MDIETTSETLELWQRYKKEAVRSDRDKLILLYMPLVKYVAGRVVAGLPSSVEHGDLVSYGTFGLIDAIEKFELDRGVKFETYAISRIKGSILDELRSIDWVPRSMRAKARALDRAYSDLEVELHRSPTATEMSTALDIPTDEYLSTAGSVATLRVASLDERLPGRGDDELTLGESLAARPSHGPMAAQVVEMRDALVRALDDMPGREMVVVVLYYCERLTLAEIGQVLGVTESRVCQIHTKAVLHLKGHLLENERL